MKKARMLKLADFLEKLNPAKFDQDHILDGTFRNPSAWDYVSMSQLKECGSAGCVAGWACIVANKPDTDPVLAMDVASKWLGLTDEEAAWLFGADGTKGSWSEGNRYDGVRSTPKQAAAAIRYLVAFPNAARVAAAYS